MTDRFVRIAAGCACILAALLCGCAANTTVILLPEQDGSNPSLAVQQGDKEVVLDKPYAAVRESPFGPYPYRASPQEVEARFGAALAAQPIRPSSYTLYFGTGQDVFTAESMQIFETVFVDVAKRPVADVVIVGHTDAVDTDAFNDSLSLRRAETVRAMLVRRGIGAESVVAVGRGKRELLIPTADGVPEPRNRRVEIVVR